MTPTRRSRIHRLAEHIREAIPVQNGYDPELAISALGGELRYAPLDHSDGSIERLDEGFVLTLPDTLADDLERRFATAHALGHLFIHLGFRMDAARWNTVTRFEDSVHHWLGFSAWEWDAEEFADAFTMPETEFRSAAAQCRSEGTYSLRSLAEHFQLPLEAIRIRGIRLGMFRGW